MGNNSDVSRPSTSSSNSRPNSRSGSSSTNRSSRPRTPQSNGRPHSKKGKFRTKFTPVKTAATNRVSNTLPNKRPSSSSSLRKMLNKNNKTLSQIHKKGNRNKYLVRPKSSPAVPLGTKQTRRKGKNIRGSDSSLILMQNDVLGESFTSANSSVGNNSVGTGISSPKPIEIRPPFVKKSKKKKS